MANDEIEKVEGEEGDPVDPALKKDGEEGDPIDPAKKEGDPTKVEETPEARKSRLERQLEQHKKKHPELYSSEPTKKDNGKKSDDFDYGEKAFLATKGIKDDEMAFVRKEMKQSSESLETLLGNDYFKGRLEAHREATLTENANPKGKREGGGAPVDSVEFWATKDISEVPQDMRAKVVNYKLKKEQEGGVFYNSQNQK